MVDRGRVLAKLDELQGYLKELRALLPVSEEDYHRGPTKRACERLLQLCIEATIDVSKKLLIGKKLGIPNDEPDVFEKLKAADILSPQTLANLKKMRGLRNVLVHEYADIDDRRILAVMTGHLGDFEQFQAEVLKCLT